MPICRKCKKKFTSDSFAKIFCGNPCTSQNYYKKTYAEKWLDKKPNTPKSNKKDLEFYLYKKGALKE